jgi:hypothetical protein
MKKLLLLLSLLSFSTGFAQVKFRVGLNSGYNATFVLDKGITDDPRYGAEATYNFSPIGATFGAELTDNFALQLESLISNQGQVFKIIDAASKQVGERKIDLQYVNIPLLFQKLGTGDKTRFNFMIGPQLSLLTRAQDIYNQTQTANVRIPEGAAPPTDKYGNAIAQNPDGTYTVPAQNTTLASISNFKNANLQLAAGFGLDVFFSDYLYLSTNVRANYGITDARNEDLINAIKNKKVSELFGKRSDLLVGVQLGLHFIFGGR